MVYWMERAQPEGLTYIVRDVENHDRACGCPALLPGFNW
jgi:hypothetical protein